MAEAVFNKHVKERGLTHKIFSDSAGTGGFHIGADPDERMMATAVKRTVVMDHKARQLCREDLQKFDYILAMDSSNHENIVNLNREYDLGEKLFLMREFDPKGGESVPDPYYGGQAGFDEVFEILDRSTRQFLNFLIEKHTL
jgi:protein-tyrosine phosphatase